MSSSWTTHDVAIPVPSPGTGSAVALPRGSEARAALSARAAIMTSSAGPFTLELWVSSDANLTRWSKRGLVSLPAVNVSGVSGTGDVHLWRDTARATWRLIVSGLSSGGAPPAVLQFESRGSLLTGWKFLGVLYTGTSTNRLECPSYAATAAGDAFLTFSWPTGSYAQFWVSGKQAADASFAPALSGQLEWGIGYAAEMTPSWPGTRA
eukprot:1670286-Prymnesium_polylepis.1